MLTIERTHDMALAHDIFSRPRIHFNCSDDACPSAFYPIDAENLWYLVPRLDGKEMGMWVFGQVSAVLFDAHVAMLPDYLGLNATNAGRAALAWMFEHSPAQRLVGSIPVFNHLAIKFAQRIGMERVGVHPKAFLKGGRLYDVAVYGISAQ